MNFLAFFPILSLMMVVHELGHFITAKMAGITVLEFGLGLPPRLLGFRFRGVLYSLNLIPFGAFVKMLGEEDPTAPGSFASKPRLTRAIVLAAGSIMNFILAVVAFTLMFLVGIPGLNPEGEVLIGGVAPDSPATAAGIQPADVVTAVNGQQVTVQTFREATQQNLDRPMQLQVRRGDGVFDAQVTPRSNPPEGQGAVGVVLAGNGLNRSGPLTSVARGFDQAMRAVGVTFLVPKLLIEGAITPGEARPISLVGMAKITGDTVDYIVDSGFWYPIFFLTGMFSAGLSVANMLPIPALDGGRLFFVILEWIRGRRIPPEREAAYHFVGIVVLLALMVLLSVNDIQNPIPTVNWGSR
jgi:regulator of sigma E protease